MEERMFGNTHILAWLEYFAQSVPVDLEKIKILDITRKNKNLIPTVESHSSVLVFTDVGHDDIFYRMWDAGLGECEVWYNEGSEPSGPILHKPVKQMIDRGINASAGMIILNPNARSTAKVGMDNSNFSTGSIRYVGSEIRAVILNKMHLSLGDTVVVVGGASIAVESAILAAEGTVIAVEYDRSDRRTLEENANKFGIHNISIIDHVDDHSLSGLPKPELAFLVASASLEQEIECLLRRNPRMEIIVYTLDFRCAGNLPATFERFGLGEIEAIQIAVSRMDAKNHLTAEPAPWIVSGKA
ncbi:MAG: precorrin-6B methylase [Oscillospiraceae bacterium]|nr:precorrin-6B methylase [Oscillospiraceae bacterium]